MFPTTGAHIYRNEDGEVTGWDGPSYDDAPDYDDRDQYDGDEDEDWPEQAACKHDSRTQIDVRSGTPALEEMPTRDAIRWECDNPNCAHQEVLTDEEYEDYMNDDPDPASTPAGFAPDGLGIDFTTRENKGFGYC